MRAHRIKTRKRQAVVVFEVFIFIAFALQTTVNLPRFAHYDLLQGSNSLSCSSLKSLILGLTHDSS